MVFQLSIELTEHFVSGDINPGNPKSRIGVRIVFINCKLPIVDTSTKTHTT